MKAPSHLICIRGKYYAQLRVPSDIAGTYGRKQHRKALRTGDYAEACKRLHAVVAEIQQEFERRRAARNEISQVGPRQSLAELARRYAHEVGERVLTERADLFEHAAANPKQFFRELPRTPHEFSYLDKLIADGDLDRLIGYTVRRRIEDRVAELKRAIHTGDLREMIKLTGQRAPGLDRQANVALALMFARSEIKVLREALSDENDADLSQASFRTGSSDLNLRKDSPAIPAVSLNRLFEKWSVETKPSASTLSTWRGHLKALEAAFPDKAIDVTSFSKEDIIRWKDTLIAEGKSAKTINGSYLACVRTVFNYGISNNFLTSNPTEGVKASGSRKAGTGKLPYTNSEVARLLALARLETNPARRWLPWLAASTGSRVGEVAQLHGQFIKEEAGIVYLDIRVAPDAGTIKEEVSERLIPLHPQLIEDGFLDYVRTRGGGPLFYGKSSGDPLKKHASKGVSNRIAAWIRGCGFTDPRKQPNHALRHWFKTEAGRVGIDSRLVDKLQGHAPRTQGDKYYHPDLASKLQALMKIKLPPE